MNFTLSRIQDLETEIDEQKCLNLQYQGHIKKVTSANKKLKEENNDLKEENQKLINKVNRLEARNQSLLEKRIQDVRVKEDRKVGDQILRFSDAYEPNAPNTPTENSTNSTNNDNDDDSDRMKFINDLKKANLKLYEENKAYKLKADENDDLKKRLAKLEAEYDKLKSDFDHVLSVSKSELLSDPRIARRIEANEERRVKELEAANIKLQSQIEKLGEKESFDLAKPIKKERS